jgi:hypothetical protein
MTGYRRPMSPAEITLAGPLLVAFWWFFVPYIHPSVERVVGRSDLATLAGTVVSISRSAPYTPAYCGRRCDPGPALHAYAHFFVDVPGRCRGTCLGDSAGNYVLDYDLAKQVPGLLQLHNGDQVTMLVESRASTKMDDNIDGRLWELKREKSTILGYDTTREYVKRAYGDPIFRDRAIAVVILVVWLCYLFFRNAGAKPDESE